MKVYLSEVFLSIEGEGVYIGTKTLFIRFAGCPLRCRWCDTPYALSIKDGKEYDICEALNLIDRLIVSNIYKANLTGGEPLLQYKAACEIAKYLKSKGLKTYLESSCYDSNRFKALLPFIDICKIEFKLRDSEAVNVNLHDRLIEENLLCLEYAIQNRRSTYIKIVVSKESSVEEVRDIVNKIFKRVNLNYLTGFVIQPAYGDEPSINKLLQIYDVVYEHYKEVRIIPQMHKVMNIK